MAALKQEINEKNNEICIKFKPKKNLSNLLPTVSYYLLPIVENISFMFLFTSS